MDNDRNYERENERLSRKLKAIKEEDWRKWWPPKEGPNVTNREMLLNLAAMAVIFLIAVFVAMPLMQMAWLRWAQYW